MRISLTLNGKRREADVEVDTRLIDMLREQFRLTGVREGCGAGECGACTVLLDGDAVCSCIVPAVQADGGVLRQPQSAGCRGAHTREDGADNRPLLFRHQAEVDTGKRGRRL